MKGKGLKTALENALYHVVYAIVIAISLIPLRALYLVSDVVAWLMHSVVRYRRKVVRQNLISSFPDKTLAEIGRIEKVYYRWLSDYFAETLKMATMSRSNIMRRLEVENIDVVNECVGRGQTVSLFLGHYCNWEWVSSLPLHIDSCAVCGQIYHPLESSVGDRVFLRLRGRFGAHNIKMDDTLKTVAGWYRKGVPSVTGYIADQVPGYGSIHYFTDFLHHDTPVFTGAERISRLVHAACFYVHLSRPSRGRYVLRFEKIADDASREAKFAVTESYFRHLESQIQSAPGYWLWSHRRWKRTRERFNALYGAEADSRLSRL